MSVFSITANDLVTNSAERELELYRNRLDAKGMTLLKQGVWLYFFLLIFEGALRKWVVPGLATPLLIIRDPLALWILVKASNRGLLPWNSYSIFMFVIGVLGLITAITMGHGNPWVAIFGARILLIHFPLMFVIGKIFDRDDVVKMGKMTLLICFPMTVLIMFQFYSPQSAWVNRAVGGETGAGFGGALGFLRPPGTFSFTNGTALFYGFATSFIVYFGINPNGVNKIVLIAAAVGLLAAIPLSISRTVLFQVVLCFLFAASALFRNPKYIGKLIGIFIGVLILLAALSQTKIFQVSSGAFTHRFETASEEEGGLEGTIIDRFLGGMIGEIGRSSEQPFFGSGIGMSTNVGIMLLSGKQTVMINDAEWGRIIGEMGAVLGLALVFVRIGVVVKLSLASFKTLAKPDILPWLLLSFGGPVILQGQWAQPTALGFSTLIGGLMIASFKSPKEKPQEKIRTV
jgi:hypothetical protein